MAIPVPADIAFHLVLRIEALPGDQALGQAQSQAGVISPLAWFQAERPAADHIRDGRKRAACLKFNGCAHGVSRGKAEEAASKSVTGVGYHESQMYH